MARRFVHDEHGVSWLVSPGDVANGACLVLERHGYKRIVLPRAVLTTGVAGGTIDRQDMDLLTYVRILDCMEVLNETSNN